MEEKEARASLLKDQDTSKDPTTLKDAKNKEEVNKDKSMDEKTDEKEKKEPPPPALKKTSEMFRYATTCDKICIFFGILFQVLSGLLMPMMALIMGQLIDSICKPLKFVNGTQVNDETEFVPQANGETVVVLVFLVLGFIVYGVVIMVTTFLGQSLFKIPAIQQNTKIKHAYLMAVLRQDVTWFDETNSGAIQTRITADAQLMYDAMGEKLGQCFNVLASFVSGMAIGFYISWELSLVTLSVIPLMGIVMAILVKSFEAISGKGKNDVADAASISQQAISSIRTVAAYSGQNYMLRLYEKDCIKIYEGGCKISKNISVSVGLYMFLMFSSYALTLWYGSTLTIKGRIEGGDVITVFWAVLIGGMGMATLGMNMQANLKARQAAFSIFEVIDRVPVIDSQSDDGRKPSECKGCLELKDVHFFYPSRKEMSIFKGINLKVESGCTLALVGESGGGKSTIISLVQRFYDPVEGHVLLDGVDLKDLNVQWLRSNIGLVSQEPVLFSASIMENIRHGKTGATDDEVIAAAKKANAHKFITEFTKGYDTEVGNRGSQLSGGEKQRVAIARAIIRDPNILLLDEATSALDNESERVVQEALDALHKSTRKRTTIVIAHRLSTVKNADLIAVIYDGKIKELGSHDDLINIKDGFYTNLITLQDVSANKDGSSAMPSTTLSPAFIRQYSEEKSIKRTSSNHRVGSSTRNLDDDSKDEETKPDNILTVDLATVKNKDLKNLGMGDLPKDSMRRLWLMNLPEWHLLLIGFVGSFLNGVQMPALAWLLSSMIGTFFVENPIIVEREVQKYAIGFVVVGCVAALFSLSGYPVGVASGRRSTRLRKIFLKSILHQDIAFHDYVSPGSLSAQLDKDLILVQTTHEHGLQQYLGLISTGLVMLIVIFYYSWKLALVTLTVMPLMSVAGACNARMWKKEDEDPAKKLEAKLVSEVVDSARTVISLQLQPWISDIYEKSLILPTKKEIRKSHWMSFSAGIGQLLTMTAYSTVFYFGGKFREEGDLTCSELLIVIFTVMFAGGSLGQSGSLLPDRLKGAIAAARIFNIIDRVPPIDSSSELGLQPSSCEGEVELRNVHFAYPSRPDMKIFKNYNLTIKAGTTVALVGESGGGKSTVIGLIERFYDPNEGEVLLDGINLKKLNVQWLRNQIGLVNQEPTLFATTIMENIRFGKQDATDEEVMKAAKMANCHDFIENFTKGYDTDVGKQGQALSGGEKQRIAIARAIVRDPNILLLDEATSALDTTNEIVVQTALDALLLAKKRTTIVVAHRLSTVKDADLIAVIYDGKIVEKGTHSELLAHKDGHYTRLCRLQVQKNETSSDEKKNTVVVHTTPSSTSNMK